MKTVFAEKCYNAQTRFHSEEAATNENPVSEWANATLTGRVCRENPQGYGKIICGRDCECYDTCEVGKEFVKRGLDKELRRLNMAGTLRNNPMMLDTSVIRILDQLTEIRKAAGMTQEEWAARCYVTKPTIRAWEWHRAAPSLNTLCKILKRHGYRLVVRRDDE